MSDTKQAIASLKSAATHAFTRGNKSLSLRLDEARLITAAHDELVAALEKIVKFADTEPDGGETVAMHRANIERARAALAKVNGSTVTA